MITVYLKSYGPYQLKNAVQAALKVGWKFNHWVKQPMTVHGILYKAKLTKDL